MAIRSPPAGTIPPESPRFCVCNLGSDGVGGAVTPETLLLLLISIFIRRHLITSSSDLHFAASISLTDQLKSHVSRVRNQSKRTRRVPDDTSITGGFKTIRGRRSSCRHVDDVSALLSPGLTRLPINVSSSNRPRPSRLSTWGRAASSPDNTR